MKHRDLFGTDPDFPGLPYTVSAQVAAIRDGIAAVQKSIIMRGLQSGESECLTRVLDALEDLFSELQERFAPKRTLDEMFDEAQRDHEFFMAKAVAPGPACEEPENQPGPDLMDKDTMISVLASLGIDYHPKITAVEVGGETKYTTSTRNPSLDVYDLALALMDGEISSADAVAKLVHIGKLISEKDGTREGVEYFRDKLERIHALKAGKRVTN